MAFQLDDLLKEDKKDGNLLPDLSKATCNSQEEFRRLFENCPEFKIKPEKVRIEFFAYSTRRSEMLRRS